MALRESSCYWPPLELMKRAEHSHYPANNPLRAERANFRQMKNVGGKERFARAAFGSSIVVVDFLATVQIEVLFLLVGLWGVLTSAFGYCPFNGLLNRNSCAIDLRPTQA